MRDDAGIVQIFTVNPAGGESRQLTHDARGVASAFSWSPDGLQITCVIDGSVCLVAADSGAVTRLTPPVRDGSAPRPEACVISPDGRRIAYVRHIAGSDGQAWNQIFTVETR
jgi:Tol biopolymer transport system component